MKNNALFAAFAFFLAGTLHAATFVYVSNADDGDIGVYTLGADGALTPGAKVAAGGKPVMPMSVSPNKRYLYAAVRSKPFTAVAYSIDRKSGALKEIGRGELAESFPYILADKTGNWLLGASYGAHLVSVNPIGKDGQGGQPATGHPDGAQRALDHYRQDQSLRVRAAPGHRPGLPVQVRREDRQADGEHAGHGADESGNRPAAHHHVGRQQVRLPAQRADRHGDHAVARRQDRPAQAGERGFGAGAGLEAGAGRATRRHQRAGRRQAAAARRVERHLGLGPAPDAERQVPLRRRAHRQPDRRTERGRRHRQADLPLEHPTEPQPRGFRIDPTGKYMVVTGEKSDTISVYAIGADGALRLLQKYPTGKGSNWVEIVSFD
jgi:6-phosphogluconolactonase